MGGARDNPLTTVPDLRQLKHPSDRDYWNQWVLNDKLGTLMLAFSIKERGLLNDKQGKSLVVYLTNYFLTKPKVAPVLK